MTNIAPRRFRNPVIPGAHPDPSICRVGDDFYLATSTFGWFPAIALHHSRDLVHWRAIGSVFDRPGQLDLEGVDLHHGIFAPTLRYSAGMFYIVCTVVDPRGLVRSGSFVTTATDPAGAWSDPIWVEDAPGFDPSLLFDDDGRVWWCGAWEHDRESRPGRLVIWVQEIDPGNWKLFGERHAVWEGALHGAKWAEGPHIYHIDDWYYLLAAEGGTEAEHAVVVARARSVVGPYEGCPRNPLLTSRHLGGTPDVFGPGHADLVQTQTGQWWAVLLAARPTGDGWWGTSRETFLVRVEWEAGWPVFSPGAGRVVLEGQAPDLPEHLWPATAACEQFDSAELGTEWLTMRLPQRHRWSLSARPGHLRLHGQAAAIDERYDPTFVGRRVEHADWAAAMSLESAAEAGGAAGLLLVATDERQARVEVRPGQGTANDVSLILRVEGVERVIGTVSATAGPIRLAVEAHGRTLMARTASPAESTWAVVGEVDLGPLGATEAGYFFGLVVGPYAAGAGTTADVDWFEYRNLL